ncbi:MAG: GNAT family N-acetyltransferase, partial [Pseudomonadota bacterium]
MSSALATIETERLILRRWRESDLADLTEVYACNEHARFVGGGKEPWAVWRDMALYEGHFTLRGYSLFALEEKTTGETLGWAGPWYPEGFPEPEIGYALKPSATGKGFAKEAVIRCLAYVYETIGWKTAISAIDPDNKASQAVAKSVGAVQESEPVKICGCNVYLWRHLSPNEFRER